ncbi:hypothetical protein [Roseobacter sp. EG26]|uniref:hypothetical protein n=1 Tax=Roseobacter sp. EG26 TaxID=3412477 RepID=UPI003CE5C6BC
MFLKATTVNLADVIQIAERVVTESEELGFCNTADAMRQVLKEMTPYSRQEMANVKFSINLR